MSTTMRVVAEAVLLAGFGSSGPAEETEAEFVTRPFWVGLTTIRTVAVELLGRSPRSQVTVDPLTLQFPCDQFTDRHRTDLGRWSVSSTPVAV